MSRKTTRAALATYLTSGVTSNSVPYLSTVYANPPKLAKEDDFYTAQIEGNEFGAVIFVYIGPTKRKRIAVGQVPATPVQAFTGGRKWVEYDCALMCYLRSTADDSEDAGTANDAFLDGLISWIEADRNLGTIVQQGPGGSVPPGAIFQAGEGGEQGGWDLGVHSMLPRPNRMGTVTVFTSVDITVCEVISA